MFHIESYEHSVTFVTFIYDNFVKSYTSCPEIMIFWTIFSFLSGCFPNQNMSTINLVSWGSNSGSSSSINERVIFCLMNIEAIVQMSSYL